MFTSDIFLCVEDFKRYCHDVHLERMVMTEDNNSRNSFYTAKENGGATYRKLLIDLVSTCCSLEGGECSCHDYNRQNDCLLSFDVQFAAFII